MTAIWGGAAVAAGAGAEEAVTALEIPRPSVRGMKVAGSGSQCERSCRDKESERGYRQVGLRRGRE
jgi:hypothetical protein